MAERIPRRLHAIWVGDESRCPHDWIATWKTMNPKWDFTLWGNDDMWLVNDYGCRTQLERCRDAGHWEGVADILRYAILHRFGGVYFDADSVALQPVNPEWLARGFFACYESELHMPGLIANSFLGAIPRHWVFAELLRLIAANPDPLRRWSNRKGTTQRCPSWMSLGPLLLTRTLGLSALRGAHLQILPSETFTPRHRLDTEERHGPGVYARHFGHLAMQGERNA